MSELIDECQLCYPVTSDMKLVCIVGMSLDKIKLLLPTSNINALDDTQSNALMHACKNITITYEILELLVIKCNANNFNYESVDDDGYTAIIYLLQNESVTFEMVKMMLCVCMLTHPNNNGFLFFALSNNNVTPKIIELLLSIDCNLDAKDDEGRNPLMVALNCQKNLNMVKIVKILMLANKLQSTELPALNYNEIDDYGYTALMLACENPFITVEIIEILLLECNPNIISEYGNTALMLACMNPNITIDILKVLILKSTVPTITAKDNEGMSALRTACNTENITFEMLLLFTPYYKYDDFLKELEDTTKTKYMDLIDTHYSSCYI